MEKKKKKKGTAEQWGMDGFLDKCYLINQIQVWNKMKLNPNFSPYTLNEFYVNYRSTVKGKAIKLM